MQKTSASHCERENFLIFRTGQLGDMIATVPAIHAIRESWPQAKLTLLCDMHPGKGYIGGADIFRGSGLIDEFERYEVQGHETSRLRRAASMLRLLARLRGRRFDALFYLAPSIRSPEQVRRDRRFFRSAGIRRFYGMNHFPPVPYNDPKRPMVAAGHEVDLLLRRLRSDGLKVPDEGKAALESN